MKVTSCILALMSLSVAGLAAAHSDHAAPAPLVDHVRKANQRFQDVSVAVAEG